MPLEQEPLSKIARLILRQKKLGFSAAKLLLSWVSSQH